MLQKEKPLKQFHHICTFVPEIVIGQFCERAACCCIELGGVLSELVPWRPGGHDYPANLALSQQSRQRYKLLRQTGCGIGTSWTRTHCWQTKVRNEATEFATQNYRHQGGVAHFYFGKRSVFLSNTQVRFSSSVILLMLSRENLRLSSAANPTLFCFCPCFST